MIKQLEEKILNGNSISREDALYISEVSGPDIFELFISANKIRNHFIGNRAELCSIINAKSGACPEDCSFCAQSLKSRAEINVYPLLDKKTVIQEAKDAKQSGITRFSIVTSGRNVSKKDLLAIADMISEIRNAGLLPCASLGLLRGKDLLAIADMISEIRNAGLLPCASLGLLSGKDLSLLKSAGLERYHHNLETSERFFPKICTTHSYADKLKTVDASKSAGLSICSGGIFGMGETWRDRIDMAFLLKELDVDSVPINFLIPVKGTSLENREFLHPFDALKILSLYRFILPQKRIRICGGRFQILNEFNSMVFFAGADSLLTGNYLTTTGRSYEDDLRLIKSYGLTT